MYRNWGRILAEWAHFGELNSSNIHRFVTYDGAENLARALALCEQHGLLVLTAHFGNFELLPFAYSLYGHQIAIIHRPLRNPIVDQRVREVRTRFGNEAIARKRAAVAMVRCLHAKRQVAVALDLDVRRGVFVDFFGLKASTSAGLARLAMATGAPVVPAFMVREGDTPRHKITVLPLLEIAKTRDREACVSENTQRMTNVIEAMIRRHPDHWNWIHRRWKTRPPGEHRFY
jgi:Kdo2-lipid IVA lauroyltransferase/acyltransferase